jgi:branched-chain amino acid transport system ATP-binding protein
MLQTEGLEVGYSGRGVLHSLDLQVRSGEVVALLGRNGVGKTTTLKTIAGLLAPIDGSIDIAGAPARGPLHRRARAGLAYVSEERSLIRKLSVADNLRLARVEASAAYRIFPELEKLRSRPAGMLSGGEQQMLALGRCLAATPRLVLIDELSVGLAPVIVTRLMTALRAAADNGAAVLVVEQKPVVALAVSDRGYVLAQGRVAFSDTGPALLGRLDEIERSYLAGGEFAEGLDLAPD